MIEKKVTIVNPTGLHSRPAAQVVEFVKDYCGTVEIVYGDKSCNLKSILMLLTMNLKQGYEVTLRVNGENETVFIDDLAEVIKNISE